MANTLSIIIIHWNTPKLLKQQLEILSKTKTFEVIVVDNASKKTLVHLKRQHKNTQFILNDTNHGFGFACNQGAELAKGEWLLFLNPDIRMSLSQIQNILDYAANNNLDALSPSFASNDYQKPIPSLKSLVVEFTPLKHLIPLTSFGQKTLVGGCLFIKKDVLSTLDGWDENFFLWFEDSDLSKRLVDSNYKIGFYPEVVGHLGGEALKKLSQKKQNQMFFTSMQIYAKKHFSFFGQLIIKLLSKKYIN